MASESGDDRMATLTAALKVVLRPLVRVMIARGLTAPLLYRLLKEVYVEVAERDFRIDGERPTDSRISILTGVHRKDVRSFREAATGGTASHPPRANALASVVGRWLARPDLTDAAGKPLVLPRQSETGPSFDGLVASVSKDIRARTVLDELLRQGLVTLSGDGERVSLDAEAVLGPADAEQRLHFFAQNLGDHAAAAGDNLLSEDTGERRLERAVFYNRLTPEAVDALEAEARAGATALLRSLNAAAHARQSEALDRHDAIERFRFGVYFYRADEDKPPGADRAGTQSEAEHDDPT